MAKTKHPMEIADFESAGDEESFDYCNQGSTRLRLEVDFLKFVWSSTLRIFSKNVKNYFLSD